MKRAVSVSHARPRWPSVTSKWAAAKAVQASLRPKAGNRSRNLMVNAGVISNRAVIVVVTEAAIGAVTVALVAVTEGIGAAAVATGVVIAESAAAVVTAAAIVALVAVTVPRKERESAVTGAVTGLAKNLATVNNRL